MLQLQVLLTSCVGTSDPGGSQVVVYPNRHTITSAAFNDAYCVRLAAEIAAYIRGCVANLVQEKRLRKKFLAI